MTIRSKLILNILFIIVFGGGILFIVYINKNITTTMAENEKLFDNITISSFKLSLLSREVVQFPDTKRPRMQLNKEYKMLGDLIQSIPAKEKAEFKKFELLVYSYNRMLNHHKNLNKTIELLNKNDEKKALYERKVERITNDIFIEAQVIVTNAYRLKNEVLNNYTKQLDELNYTIILIVITMIAFILSFAFYLSKGIIKGLNNLSKGTMNITAGDLTHRVSEDSKDELGEFAKSFNYMVSKLAATMTTKGELENIVNDRTKELDKSRLAAISIMEDANTQRQIANKANEDLQDEIKVREETQAQLEKAKKDAEYANRSKSIFLANMSHELRTPLNAIMGFSELLRKNPNIQSEQKETLEIIHRSGDHLLKLINDVLDLAKIESGKIPINKEPFDLGNIITESVDLMEQRAEVKGLKVELDQSSSFPRYIISDAGKIRQILLNFLSNAVKNTYEGGIKVKLELEDSLIHMEVSDSGVGIAKENQNKLFEPFVQIGSASSAKGTGLGLTITKQFVELLGGSIGVESELGKGSSFWAKIPFEKSSKDDVVEIVKQEHKDIIGLDPSQKNIKILIVEDQVENRLLLKSLLDLLEIQVKEAVNGEEAVELYKSWKPDFIWMDRRMPKMNGERATQEIRKLEDGDKVIIVALTASAFHEERERMLSVGMDDFVAKPYRQNEIYEMMKKHLNLNYIYQETIQKGKKEVPKFSDKELKEMIGKLDKEIVKELDKTVILLDSESLKPILDKIENIDKNLADILISLVDNYDFGRIIKVLQLIKEGQDGK